MYSVVIQDIEKIVSAISKSPGSGSRSIDLVKRKGIHSNEERISINHKKH